MEYDNDRIIQGTHRTEVICWVVFALINPLVNSLGIFPHQPMAWIVLLMISLVVLPLYILYSKIIVPKLLFKEKYLFYGISTLLFFFLIHYLLYLLYKIAGLFFSSGGQDYFLYSTVSITRESVWIIINTILAISIAYLRINLDEKEKIETLQKENIYYKLRYFRTS